MILDCVYARIRALNFDGWEVLTQEDVVNNSSVEIDGLQDQALTRGGRRVPRSVSKAQFELLVRKHWAVIKAGSAACKEE